MQSQERICIYCGEKTPKGKARGGEHIVPEAIGGGLTLNRISENRVCEKCNNGPLSGLDEELSRRSYLSMIAAEVLQKPLCLAWNINHSSDNLLVEAGLSWKDGRLQDLPAFPQIVFERSGLEAYCNNIEAVEFGSDYAKVLCRAVYRCFQRWGKGLKKKIITFEPIETKLTQAGFRYPPRIFCNSSMKELAANWNNYSFILRYSCEADKRFALLSLSRLREDMRFTNPRYRRSSHRPKTVIVYDPLLTIVALAKMGINLIAAYCPNTPISSPEFAPVIRTILGTSHLNHHMMKLCGFVRATEIAELCAPNNGHMFRLMYEHKQWKIYYSFFGARIGACLTFPGASFEKWNCADIIAPLKSKDWKFEKRTIFYGPKVNVVLHDSELIAPSFKTQFYKSMLVRESPPG